MKILIVSNLYPPHYKGGYELRCAQVAEALADAGHEVVVQTSVYGLGTGPFGRPRHRVERSGDVLVRRELHQHAYGPRPPGRPWTLFHGARKLRDAERCLGLIETFEPDVVNWWSMNGLSKTLLPLPGRLGIPDVHWIEHPWMIDEYGAGGEREAAFWKRFWGGRWLPGPLRTVSRPLSAWIERQVAKRGLPTREYPNHPTHFCFVSEYLRDLYAEAGIDVTSSEVIHGGVHVERFHRRLSDDRWSPAGEPLRVLYASQLSSNRGLHTLLEAIGGLTPERRSMIRLNIAGDGPEEYVREQRRRVRDLGLENRVEFLGRLPHEEMPDLHARHDLLVFPTTRPEGLPLTMIEAMLSGCAVVTTPAGGAREVAALGDLPGFAYHDADALREHLTRFVDDREELRRVATRGQRTALDHFDFDTMVDRLERTLRKLAANAGTG